MFLGGEKEIKSLPKTVKKQKMESNLIIIFVFLLFIEEINFDTQSQKNVTKSVFYWK